MSENSLFSRMSPKASFLAGIGAILAVFFVVGFFVLLSMVMKDKDAGGSGVGVPTNQAAGQPAPAEIVLSPVTDSDWFRGSRDAKITFVEFSDLECPYCKSFHNEMKKLVAAYPDDVRWVYRHFPLTSIHPKAPKEAEAAECAGELGGNDAFWKYVDRVFEVSPTNNGLDLALLPEIAEYVGLDRSAFQTCLDSGKYANKVELHTAMAVDAGGQGTPYSVVLVDGEKIPLSGALPFAQLKSFVDSVIAEN